MKNILTILLILFISNSLAKDKTIDFKQKKGLKSDEGLVVLIIDINFRIAKISLGKEGKVFPVYSLKKLRPGSQMKIIKLPVGKYYWKEGRGYSANTIHTFEIGKELTSFEVKAGKLNYPGTLEFRGWLNERNDVVYQFNMLNNSTTVFTSLKEKYPKLLSKYPLTYSGKNPDPFLEFNEKLDKK
jgi:hypothetical protein